jgi:hypothetical protein
VLGTALAIKMVAYVTLAPLAAAVAKRLPRRAEDLEQLASPMIAALLLTVVSFPVLFAGTVVGFMASALLVITARQPDRTTGVDRPNVLTLFGSV